MDFTYSNLSNDEMEFFLGEDACLETSTEGLAESAIAESDQDSYVVAWHID